MLAAILLVAFSVGLYATIHFFSPKTAAQKNTTESAKEGAQANSNKAPIVPQKPTFSDVWRIAGTAKFGAVSYVVIVDENGRFRYESPSMFVQMGPQTIGEIDGAKVTRYSGAVVHPVQMEGKK
ncbi:hypothetical protein [Herbaspirillum sp. B65]|uniref:hypothetical protein n=1 Tax=Herbaspirillum sp. B65 TaxID=137708 RepID=UPI002091AD8A|nr:hypothetical protein [Herbaspirillum sp. B65]